MYALFQIVDRRYVSKVLEKASDYSHFRDRISDWIKHYPPDRWSNIKNRFDYCNNLMEKGQLGTDIDNADPDIRWQLFIENGAPQDQLTVPGRFNQDDTASTIWILVWPSAGSGQRGLEISCWSKLGQNYPTEIIPRDDEGFPLAYPIWPFVNYSKFPASDGTTDLWFSVWVPGDQFTRLTLDQGQLSMQIDLYDSSKTVLIDSGKEIANLQMMRGILETIDHQERCLIRAMGYIVFPKVKPGRYNARLTILGAPDNEGRDWIEVLIPKDKKISDLLVLEQSMVTGENVLPGILRGDIANLYDNPECRLTPRAKFDLYLETTLPNGHGKHFEVWVTLLPIPEVSGRSSTSITTGKPMVVADSLERPFTKGEWQSSRNQKYLEEMAKSESGSKSSKTITLLRKKFDATEERLTIQVAPRLKSNLRSGQYLLTVTITDPERQNYFLSARRVIRIVRLHR
ncbi:MAG: hypothetical protein NT028_04155 [candidate division Zixibacteria bacterium]|nr:hypothetical protein [candidate division Zixibacteria bacterium]